MATDLRYTFRSPGASIAVRLRLAFGSVALMTVLGCGVAIWAFRAVDRNFVSVADRGFPRATEALRLKSDSLEIELALTALAAAPNEATRAEASAKAGSVLAKLRQRVAVLAEHDDLKNELVLKMPEVLEKNVVETDDLVRQRLLLELRKVQVLSDTGAAQSEFLRAIDPVVTAANSDLLAAARRSSYQSGASVHGLVDTEIAQLRTLLQLRADAFRLSESIVEAHLTRDASGAAALQRRAATLFAQIKTGVRRLDGTDSGRTGQALVATLEPLMSSDASAPTRASSGTAGTDAASDAVRRVQAAIRAFDAALESTIARTTIDMVARSHVITGNAANAVVLLIADEVASLGAILRARGEGSLMASLIAEASSTSTAERLDEVRHAFGATRARLNEALGQVKSSGHLGATRAAYARLTALGTGELGVFANRARQLELLATGEQVILRNQQASGRFAEIVSELSTGVGTQLAEQIGALRSELRWNTIALAGLAGASLLLALLVGWLYVARRIAARLTQLSESMAQIAAGRFDAPIPSGGSDEITVMAGALRYFRDRTAAQLSKIEAGRMELDLASFDVPSAIDNAVTLVRERAARHAIKLSSTIDAALGDIVADERKFKQILLNLLSNAIKFTPEGGAITVAARVVGESAEVSVTDTGIGIAAADQALVFEEFRQANSELSRKVEGTGLGLALTRKFVELHGGTIGLVSEPGKGSTFTFCLPLEASIPAAAAPA